MGSYHRGNHRRQERGPGPWTLDPGPWTLDPGPWTLDPGPRIRDWFPESIAEYYATHILEVYNGIKSQR